MLLLQITSLYIVCSSIWIFTYCFMQLSFKSEQRSYKCKRVYIVLVGVIPFTGACYFFMLIEVAI